MKLFATILLVATLTFASLDSLKIRPAENDSLFRHKFDSVKVIKPDTSHKVQPIKMDRSVLDSLKTVCKFKRDSAISNIKDEKAKAHVVKRLEQIEKRRELRAKLRAK